MKYVFLMVHFEKQNYLTFLLKLHLEMIILTSVNIINYTGHQN